MKFDNAVVTNASDVVADNVTTLPVSPTTNRLVYLTQADGSNVAGLYIWSVTNTWILLSNGAVVT